MRLDPYKAVPVVRWSDVERSAPEFAARVRTIFEKRRHKTLATLRRDGSPRVSGVETAFQDGDIVMGMMPDSVKARDLQRDPRASLHAQSEDPPIDRPSTWEGDAKMAGRVIPIEGREPGSFRIDIDDVVLTWVPDPPDYLVVESWTAERGYRRDERR